MLLSNVCRSSDSRSRCSLRPSTSVGGGHGPNEWSSTNLYGTVYGLEVTVKDKEGRQLTKKRDVTPECGEPARQAECECICRGGYVLGQACDGGTE